MPLEVLRSKKSSVSAVWVQCYSIASSAACRFALLFISIESFAYCGMPLCVFSMSNSAIDIYALENLSKRVFFDLMGETPFNLCRTYFDLISVKIKPLFELIFTYF